MACAIGTARLAATHEDVHTTTSRIRGTQIPDTLGLPQRSPYNLQVSRQAGLRKLPPSCNSVALPSTRVFPELDTRRCPAHPPPQVTRVAPNDRLQADIPGAASPTRTSQAGAWGNRHQVTGRSCAWSGHGPPSAAPWPVSPGRCSTVGPATSSVPGPRPPRSRSRWRGRPQHHLHSSHRNLDWTPAAPRCAPHGATSTQIESVSSAVTGKRSRPEPGTTRMGAHRHGEHHEGEKSRAPPCRMARGFPLPVLRPT